MSLPISKQLPSGWPLITPSSHMTFLSNFNSGWPQLTPAGPLTPSTHYTQVWGHFYEIWWSQNIFTEFDLWLTRLTPAWHLTQQWNTLWLGVLPTKFGGYRALLSKLTPTWPSWPLHELWPWQCIMLWSGVLTKFGGHRPLLRKLTSTWPQLTPTWPLTPAMHYA